MSAISRRDVLIGVGGTAIGLGLGFGGMALWPVDGRRSAPDVDVAIIGGGVAGTLTAARLAQRMPGRSIALFEAGDRIGGRLWSVPMPSVSNEVAELGGMRIPMAHASVLDLVEELGLRTHAFTARSGADLVRLRGERLRLREVHRVDQFPYEFFASQAHLSPNELAALVVREAGLTDLAVVGRDESGSWLADLTFRGTPLWRLRSWDLLTGVLGSDGARFMQDWIGYELTDIAASSWIGVMLSVTQPDYVAVAGGMQQIPLALAASAQSAGVSLNLEWRCLSIEDDLENSGGSILQFRRADDQTSVAVRAAIVVLALPSSALRRLCVSSPMLAEAPELKRALSHVLESDAMKLYFTYDRAWWRDLDLEPGRSVSDGPLRQTVYFPEDSRGQSMVLASYAFGPNYAQAFGELTLTPSAAAGARLDASVVQQVTAALSDLHGIAVPPPLDARGYRWGDSVDGPEVPLWAPGIKPWEVAPAVIKPVTRRRVFVCGDSLSLNQGWIQGALQTTESVLRTIIA